MSDRQETWRLEGHRAEINSENFSACLTFGPFDCTERPEEYAWGKASAAARAGRDEGGPAILIVDIPDDIIALAVVAWPRLERRIIPFTDPRR